MEEDFYSHRRSNLIFLFLLTTSVFFMTARLSDYVTGFKNFLFYLVSPTPVTSSKVINSSQRFSRNIKELVNARQENILLRNKIEQYARLENEYMRSKEENSRLRAIFKFLPTLSKKTIVGNVIGREPNSWFQWVMMDKGSSDGIVIDEPVLVWSNNRFCVLGRIGEVHKNHSKVILITNALSALPAMIDKTGQDGLLEGQNSNLIRLNYLIKGSDTKIGDMLVTSPLSSVFPPNILIGQIIETATSDDERFKSVLINPCVELNNIKEVVVLVQE